MFAIGEAVGEIDQKKLQLPRGFGLGKRNKIIYGAWADDKILYLSDEMTPLRAKIGKEKGIFLAKIDATSRITVPAHLRSSKAHIMGHISTIRIEFMDKKAEVV